ncbi:phage-associated cell wall hydrolase [Streptococcus pyogenes]|nr:phage-associated cell wall hydrolase [Streptococcus pyogenes]
MQEIFNFKGQEVRTVTIDDEPYFVGKDVAEINVRRWPSLASEVVGSYKQGDTVSFDSEGYANGYYWISYVGGSGMRNYLGIGQTDKDGNRISIWGKLN